MRFFLPVDNSSSENHSFFSGLDIRDGFSSAQNPMHYSAEAEEAPKSFAKKAFLKLAKKSHIKGDKIIVEEQIWTAHLS